MVKLKLFFILLTIYVAEPARILGIFPAPNLNQFTLGFRLMKELASRGHEVTMVSPFPQKAPIANYTDIYVETGEIDDFLRNYNRDEACIMKKIKYLHHMAYSLTEKLFFHHKFQELLRSKANFDVIIIDYFLNEAILGVGKVFDAPVVLFSSLPSFTSSNELFANPAPSSFIPHLLTEYTGDMDLPQRFVNLAYNTFDAIYKYHYTFPLHDKLLKTHISKGLDLEDVMHNVSLILLNSHPSISGSVPHVPSMIEIGGFHIQPPNELPTELQTFMDNATEGVVIVSTELYLPAFDFSNRTRKAILTSLGKIKQKVLWKYGEDLPGLPDNVKLVKWLPQQDLLAHPNAKALISHGDMLSTIEAVHHGVPIIGLPVYGNEKMNIAKAARNGYAISVPLHELSEETLSSALHEILNNPKYANNVKARSKIMNDRLVSPIDSAVYWIEYAVRHKGSDQLQSAGVHLSWYKRNMIDIIIILTIVDILLFVIFYFIIKHVIHLMARTIRNRKGRKYEKLDK